MMELTLPQFEYRLESGVVALRDGFTAVFFLPAPHQRLAASVRAAVDLYLSLPGIPERFGTIDEDGLPVMHDPGVLPEVIGAALDDHELEADFQLIDSPDDASRFSVRYHGLDLQRRAEEGWPHAASGIKFTFPTDYLGESGLLELFNFSNELAGMLPFSFGYLAPAFVYLEGIGEDGAFKIIGGLSKRDRCLDIPALLPDCFEVGDGPKGAYWGNYLGAALLERLGGEKSVRTHFAGHDVKVAPLDGGAMTIYLDRIPIPGDVNRQEDVARYKAAFSLFSEFMLPRRVPYMNFDDEAMRDWLYRFAGESGESGE